MLNFFAMILCFMFAIFYAGTRDIGFCLLELGLALINLPFAIKWFRDYIL